MIQKIEALYVESREMLRLGCISPDDITRNHRFSLCTRSRLGRYELLLYLHFVVLIWLSYSQIRFHRASNFSQG